MSCPEEFQADISALMDGELERDETLRVIDRLLEDSDCREGYLEMRRLTTVVAAAEIPGSLPERAWKTIRSKTGLDAPVRSWAWLRPIPVPAWMLGAAAVLVLSLLVWTNVPTEVDPGVRFQPGVTIEVGSNEDAMTDQRFVELTTEILQADRRYHRKMLEVMNEIEGNTFIAEGSNSDARRVVPEGGRERRDSDPEIGG